MNKGLLYGLGSLAALIIAKNKSKGSGNNSTSDICNSCLTGDGVEYTAKDLYNIMNECGYYLPQTAQVFEELIQDEISDKSSFGSLSKLSMEEVLKQAVTAGTVTQNSVDNFLKVYKGTKEKSLTSEQKKELRELIRKLNDKPYQVQILFSIGIEVYTNAKQVAELIRSVGSRTFINRYLQRTAFVIDESQQETPLYQNAEMWKRQWVCDKISDISDELIKKGLINIDEQEIIEQNITDQQDKKLSNQINQVRKKELENIILYEEKRLAILGLDLNRERIDFDRTTTGKILKDKPLPEFQKLEKLSDVVWFIEMALQCGVKSQKNLFYTFPQETVFSRKIKNLSIFDQIKYKLHIPCLSLNNIDSQFPNVSNSLGYEEIQELINNEMLVLDPELHKPYIFFYDKETNQKSVMCFYSYASGAMRSKRTPVFTKTSKMNTISFSIPAGPPSAGGSCISAATSKMAAKPSFGVNDLTYVCQKCYALRNRYQMLDYVFSSAPRMNWITSCISSSLEKNRLNFGVLLALAVESYSRYCYENGREILEIGVIESNKLKYRSSKTTYSHIEPCDITPNINKVLPPQDRGSYNSQFWIDLNKNNDVAGYFRIHDSGDFSISTNAQINGLYIQSWGIVSSCFPQVKFWAPTRLWNKQYASEDKIKSENAGLVLESMKILKQKLKKQLTPQIFKSFRFQKALVQAKDEKSLSKKYLQLFQSVCEDNPNLIIRPSGLTVVSPFNNQFIGIPEVYVFNPAYKDISAGSGVNAVFVKNKKQTDFTASAYKYVGTNEAFTRYRQNGGKETKSRFKEKVKFFLSNYFASFYNVSSFEELPQKSYTPIYSQSQVWTGKKSLVQQCPVDTKTDEFGNEISSNSSCMSSSCRFCWLAKNNCVTYGEH